MPPRPAVRVRPTGRRARVGTGLRLVAAGAAVALLSGCPGIPKETAAYATTVDIDRASVAWGDPWVAGTTTASAGGANLTSVENLVASRAYSSTLPVRDLLAGEVADAAQTGWQLVAASCQPAGTGAALLSRGSGPEDGLLAEVVVANNNVTSKTAQELVNSTVEVTVHAAFHAQTWWPDVTPGTFDSGCPAGDDATFKPTPLPELTDLIGQDQRIDGPTPQAPQQWDTDQPGATFSDAVKATNADPLLQQLGVATLPEAKLDWASPQLELPTTTSTKQLTSFLDVINSLAATDWTMTFASCSGRTERIVIEMSKNYADRGRTVLQLQWGVQRPNEDPNMGPAAGRGTISVAVVASIAPTERATGCWDPAGKTSGAVLTTSGKPSFGPLKIWPIQGLGP